MKYMISLTRSSSSSFSISFRYVYYVYYSAFGRFGEIKNIKIPPNKACAFLDFGTHDVAANVLKELNGVAIIGMHA